ncbi:MAG: class I SAM-dependent methyltransferase [Anaerolineaceae bacterium]
MSTNLLFPNARIDLSSLQDLQKKPLPYTMGEPLFWNDPYISKQMLIAHLDPTIDAASRKPETIDKSVSWIIQESNIKPGNSVLDLGCGPGLYASRLAQKGFHVTGVDLSKRSIDYARQYALEQGLIIDYRCEDYISLSDVNMYDAALLIYGDFCPLSPLQRKKLLKNVHRALKPGGAFILDVSQFNTTKPDRSRSDWYIDRDGFWRESTHLVLENTFSYIEDALYLDQYIIIEANGTTSVYRIWRQEYTPETITQELKADGFFIQSLWGDLTGIPCCESSEWIGIVSRKV